MLKEKYHTQIIPVLKEQFSYKTLMQVPKLKKITINMGVGKDGVRDPKSVTAAAQDLAMIAGQRPIITQAKKSISSYKLRKGMNIGCMVTLRGAIMYDFLVKVIYVALPRERDFKGIKKTQFDGNGNCSFGIREHIVFPEINYDKIHKIWGMDINIVTTAKTDKEAVALLSQLGLPFYS